MNSIKTTIGTIHCGDKIVISGMLKDEWTRSVIQITKSYIKVVGGIKFDLDTLTSRECSAHKIIRVTDRMARWYGENNA